MSKKLDDDDLLELLNRKEQNASSYINGQLRAERETSLREYYREPYGNEDDNWSTIVASDVSDTVEWILPALLKTFSSTDKAVSFEPTRQEDVKGAEQATDACNYVFFKQNNGFLVLYTAFKDALTVKNSATMWRKETIETVSSIPFKNASEEMIALLLQDAEDGEVTEATPAPIINPQTQQPEMDLMTGQPMMGYTGRIKKTEKKTVIRVESFSPEDLLVERDWTSPLLADCPYVARMMRVTMTDIADMGLKCDASDLRASDTTEYSSDETSRLFAQNQIEASEAFKETDTDDDSMAEGWLRVEFVLADKDGDGIAERLCVYRLKDKILKCELTSHVPIATFSPILNTHRWDGMSMAEAVSDLQRLHTELLRQTLDNLYLTNNPRTKVLTDANWSPLANIDDLLDSRPGGVIRQRDVNAVTEQVTPFAAAASMPMLDYVKGMREERTGVSRTSQGMNPDSLNNTATGRQIDQSAAMQRIELIARIAAETLLKPIFQGILKLLTDGGMEKLAFRLRNEFVEYDPNEWRDSYDMTVNVGLGTGDTQQKAAQLMNIYQMQTAAMQFGLVTPKHLYHTSAKVIENAGFKDVDNFIQDPSKQPPPPPPPPPEAIQIAQMKAQNDAQKFQAESQNDILKFQAETQMAREIEQIKADAKLQETRAQLELQASNDQRDAEREMMKAQMDAQLESQRLGFEKWKAELEARVKLRIAQIGNEQSGDELMAEVEDGLAMGKSNPMDQLAQMHMETLQMIGQLAQNMNAPKVIVRDANGKAIGVQGA
jgi:hypothetical protein